MKLPDEIYVVVCDHDGFKDGQPIIWETTIGEESTKKGALRQVEKFRDRYGETKIARLVFDEHDLLVEQLKSLKEFERHDSDTLDAWF